METSCLDSLVNLPDVVGAFLGHRDGRIIAHELPEFLALEQLQKAAVLLNQNRNAASAAVGEVKRCEFRYSDYKFIIYYLEEGQLFVLCRPKVNQERVDLEVNSRLNEFRELLATAAVKGTSASPVQSSNIPETVGEKNQPAKSGRLVPLLIGVAFTLIALLGAGFFFLLGETRSEKAVAVAAPAETVKIIPPEPAELPAEIILRLHGSNTIGAKLAPALAGAFLEKELGAHDIRAVPGDLADQQQVRGITGDGRQVAIEIHAHGSSTSFKDLDGGLCDVGMASRSIKEKEVVELARFGDMTGAASEHVLALDGIAVIVHPANAIDRLSQQQIAAIFSGAVRNWDDLPGSRISGAIRVIARDNKSGTWDTFKHLVLRGAELIDSAERLEDSRELTRKVAADSNAIGFIGLPYIKPSKAISVSETGTEPIYPTPFTVATEDYPLARRLFLYIPATPDNPLSRPFVEFALGTQGQQIAREIGFVELTIDEIDAQVPHTAPAEYLRNVADAARLSLNFRFRSGSAALDNRGLRDIDRLVAFLNRQDNRQRKVRLFGFADNIGARDVNCRLSQIRAREVENILKTRGILAETTRGYCEDMPVATNDTASGREKNRRVEVWLTR